MRTTSHDGVRITFEVVGRGRPLVLLHGFYGDRTTWHQSGHVAALADDHRLVLIDAHGHGESDAPHDTDHLAARRTSRLTALIAGGAHAGAVAADPDEVAQETELFRTQGTAPFIAWLERSGPLPPWFRTTMQAADQLALAALTTALATREDITATLAETSVPPPPTGRRPRAPTPLNPLHRRQNP